jgi:UDP-N-acetylmuramoyl-L-alanyl-D-glutamate--2,6-diaminopimelate ligase
VVVNDIKSAQGLIAHYLHQKPSSALSMIGVTGTAGKTTTTYAIRHILKHCGVPTGLIGGVECIAGSDTWPATLTTPDCSKVHRLLQKMVQAGEKACCMEVTSHALVQGRVEGITFDLALFTNLSHEHLDYHKNMQEYAAAKALLFQGLRKEAHAIVNIDSPWCSEILKGCVSEITRYSANPQTSSLSTKKVDLQAVDILHTTAGSSKEEYNTTFTLLAFGKKYHVRTPLIGTFNVENLLGAIGAAHHARVELPAIIEALKSFQGPPGRLEQVFGNKAIRVFVDYAHKPEALEKVLQSVRPSCRGKLIVVFGCGGDRDKEKRRRMGAIAEMLADYVIVTTDNPRSEDPELIIKEILAGCKKRPVVEIDREAAIFQACRIATPEDVVIIAGKGHEKEQVFKDRRVHFDDVEVVKRALL